ncbi:MAG TPA: hypothetical protein VFN77_07430 [Acetobacteraceae bacterium]|nr:hypothetical protein [Acetobacteraceae bacterium]
MLLQLPVFRRFRQPVAHVEAERPDQRADDERDTPRAVMHGRRRQAGDHDQPDPRRQHPAQRLGGHLKAAEGHPPVGRGVFHQQGRGVAELAADRDALHDAPEHDDQGRRYADGGKGGRHAQGQGAEGHHGDQQGKRAPPPVPVGIGAEQDAAHRAHDEADREGRIGQQEREIAALGKEGPGNGAGEIAVGDEVEPFEPVADH